MQQALQIDFDTLQRIELYKMEEDGEAEFQGFVGTRLVSKLKYTFTSREDIEQIKSLLAVQRVSAGMVRMLGKYHFDLIAADGQRTQIMYVGRGLLRSETIWSGDAVLANPNAFLGWMVDLGFPELLAGELAQQEREKKGVEKERLVHAKIPKGLLGPDGRLDTSIARGNHFEHYKQLRATYENEEQLLLDLFELLAFRTSNWWEITMLEVVIVRVLSGAPIASIERAINNAALTSLQADGIGRFFISGEFQRRYKQDGIVIEKAVLEKVFAFIEQSQNEKKVNNYRNKMLPEA